MAAEYSRELSTKVFQGACRLIQLGLQAAGYGLRRMLVDQSGQEKGVLSLGERKSIQTDRVILVPGPDHEVADVRWNHSLTLKVCMFILKKTSHECMALRSHASIGYYLMNPMESQATEI